MDGLFVWEGEGAMFRSLTENIVEKKFSPVCFWCQYKSAQDAM